MGQSQTSGAVIGCPRGHSIAIYGNSFLFWARCARQLPVAISLAYTAKQNVPRAGDRAGNGGRARNVECVRAILVSTFLKRTDPFTELHRLARRSPGRSMLFHLYIN